MLHNIGFRSKLAHKILLVLMLVLIMVVSEFGTPFKIRIASAAENKLGDKPYMGWSSWSLQSSNYPGLNPQGKYSWLTEKNVLANVDVIANQLASHGYEYVNIDSGWWMDWNWNQQYDEYGRPKPNSDRFPHGMKWIGDTIHQKKLKYGIYMTIGLEKADYDQGNFPIFGHENCHTHDIVYPDLRMTSGFETAYKIDFNQPCAPYFIESIANLFASWGVDFLKLDGVGPGSDHKGANYDNTEDVKAWSAALVKTGRPILFILSWALDHDYVSTWKQYTNGWRIDGDVECYCNTLVTWNHSVRQRFNDVIPWLSDANAGGWNNLDSLDVAVGKMDGLSEAERQTYMTFWAIQAAPLYSGDDLTQMDEFGRALLTNDEVIAIDQAGHPATPIQSGPVQQVWQIKNADGSYFVALFNLSVSQVKVSVNWSDLGLGSSASVRDLWSHSELGTIENGFSATFAAHSSRLLKVSPIQ